MVESAEHFVGDGEATRITRFMCDVLKTMLLSNWTVRLSPDPCGEENHAEVTILTGRHVATVYVSSDWNTLEDEEKINVLVHEAMHVLHFRVTKHAMASIRESKYLPEPTFDLWYESVRVEAELMCDGLANAFTAFTRVQERWEELAPKKSRQRKAKAYDPEEAAMA
jgi:hypothetical protein